MYTWITGSSGLLGFHLLCTAPTSFKLLALYRNERFRPLLQRISVENLKLELSDPQALEEALHRYPPSQLLHAAAQTDSGYCERHPDRAERDNVCVTQNLAMACINRRIRLTYLSTDLVFDGLQGNYKETDVPHPRGVYAQSKLKAEDEALRCPDALIVRLPLLLGCSPSGTRSADEVLRNALLAGKTISLFEDEFRTPLHARLAAICIWKLISKNACGIYHLAGSTRLSRYDLGIALAERLKLTTHSIQRSSIRLYEGQPPRCPDVSMQLTKLYACIGPQRLALEDSFSSALAGESVNAI